MTWPPEPKPQKNQDRPIRYLTTSEEHLMYGVDESDWEGTLHNPPCPMCFYGVLTEEIGATGTFWICTGELGCNQRYWLDNPEAA